jgi:hypothetical protein
MLSLAPASRVFPGVRGGLRAAGSAANGPTGKENSPHGQFQKG